MNQKELKEKFKNELVKKNVHLECPICGQKELSIEGPFSKTIQENFGVKALGGPSIPTLAIVCNNCGYLREFAIGALGLLDEVNKKLEPK